MKNRFLSLTAIAVLTLGIGGCTAKQEATEIKEKSVCPVLNIENITQEQFYEAKDLMEGLRFAVPNALTVYTDIL